MSDLFGNHIVGFHTRCLNYFVQGGEYFYLRFTVLQHGISDFQTNYQNDEYLGLAPVDIFFFL